MNQQLRPVQKGKKMEKNNDSSIIHSKFN